MTRATPTTAQVTAALQSRIEAFQQFGVQLPRGEVAERRPDVETHQVLVPVARGVLEPHDVEPATDRLAERDVGLRVVVLVDLALQPGQRDLGSAVRLQGLPDVPVLLGQRVNPGVDDDLEAAGRQVSDVPTWAAALRPWHATSLRLLIAHLIARGELTLPVRWLKPFTYWAPPTGFEPAHPPPEGGALSPELRGLGTEEEHYQSSWVGRASAWGSRAHGPGWSRAGP
jgi:hypothetical protein